MDGEKSCVAYRDRGLVLKGIGAAMLLVGVAAAFVGPLEMYCFYLFSEGGRLHYEGFGVGAFMFANIASQILGYYVIAAVCIPLGYGHLKLRRWAMASMLALLWSWLVAGLPLTIVLYLMYAQAKDPSLAALLMTVPFAVILYPVAPVLLIRLYGSADVRATFGHSDPAPSWLESVPLAVRAVCVIVCLYIVGLHIMILLRGLFPLFGVLLSELPGIVATDVVIVVLVALVWGLARLQPWAWWASMATFGLLTLSSWMTLPRYTLADILLLLRLPPVEMAAFESLPFQGLHLTQVASIPLLATTALILLTRRHFCRG